MDMEGQGDEGPRGEETMVGKEGSVLMGFYLGGQHTAHCPRWASLVAQSIIKKKKTCLQCGRPGFDPRVGKIPWRRERLPTLVFWPGEFHGLYSPWGRKQSNTN